MNPETIPDTTALLGSKLRIPQHVVYRPFPSETVVLNLQTGRYHGLNPTAGSMLGVLEKAPSVAVAAAQVAAAYEQPQPEVERDMCALCSLLLERGLIELDEPASG